MTQRRQFVRTIARAPRRGMFWARTRSQLTGALTESRDMLSTWAAVQGILKNPPGLTVIRWIVNIHYRGVAVDDNILNLVMGMIVRPEEDVPTANVLTSGENEADFVMWQHVAWVQERQQGTPTQNLMKSTHWDIRSARKLLATGRTAFMLLEAQDSDTMDWSWSSSLLVKLP